MCFWRILCRYHSAATPLTIMLLNFWIRYKIRTFLNDKIKLRVSESICCIVLDILRTPDSTPRSQGATVRILWTGGIHLSLVRHFSHLWLFSHRFRKAWMSCTFGNNRWSSYDTTWSITYCTWGADKRKNHKCGNISVLISGAFFKRSCWLVTLGSNRKFIRIYYKNVVRNIFS